MSDSEARDDPDAKEAERQAAIRRARLALRQQSLAYIADFEDRVRQETMRLECMRAEIEGAYERLEILADEQSMAWAPAMLRMNYDELKERVFFEPAGKKQKVVEEEE